MAMAKTTCCYPGCDEPHASSQSYCRKHTALHARLRYKRRKITVIRDGLLRAVEFLERIRDQDQVTVRRAIQLLRQHAAEYAGEEHIFNFYQEAVERKHRREGPQPATVDTPMIRPSPVDERPPDGYLEYFRLPGRF